MAQCAVSLGTLRAGTTARRRRPWALNSLEATPWDQGSSGVLCFSPGVSSPRPPPPAKDSESFPGNRLPEREAPKRLLSF